jgi:hypothetical protein
MPPAASRLPSLLASVTAAALAALVGLTAATGAQAPAVSAQARESAYRANNIGVTRLEQFDFGSAAAAFREALAADPALAIAQLQSALYLLNGTFTVTVFVATFPASSRHSIVIV